MNPKHLILIFFLVLANHCRVLSDSMVNEMFIHHYTTIIQSTTDNYGPDKTPMWLSSWDLKTDEYPFDFSHSDSIPCRVYLDRFVDAPGGSSLYWNLPDIAAAVELSRISGNPVFENAAKSYVGDYLDKCISKNGIILWGNHYYYDVVKDEVVKFYSNEQPEPIDFDNETGDLHEMRPILPPWELLYQWFPKRIGKHIRQSAQNHLVSNETGEFNRHANQQGEYAFLEAGSILINSLAFLYSKTDDLELLKMANAILGFSFSNRNPETGLVINSPSVARWDQHTSTTEIGLWALNILKATQFVSGEEKARWVQIVEQALHPWLIHGYDPNEGKFYGSLNVTNAGPIEKKDNYPYRPGTYADIWNPLFPTHNYPLQFAECCLLLYQINGKELYKNASGKWLGTVKNQLEGRSSKTLYAENYARVIHFLNNYGNIFNDNWARKRARQLGREAMSGLYVKEAQMFRGHTREMRYDCVDGVGYLFFAMNCLDTGTGTALYGSFF